MRVVAERNGGSSLGKQSQQAEFERHLDGLSRLADRALQDGANQPACTLMLRSAKSAPARALTQAQEALATAGVTVKAILTTIEPEKELHAFFETLAALLPNGELSANVRWARNPLLSDAHEQAVYGPDLCWTGDAVRRDADKRNRLVLFQNGQDAIVRGTHAFKAVWAVSDPMPSHLLDIRSAERRQLAESCSKDAPLAALEQPIEGWPLLRH